MSQIVKSWLVMSVIALFGCTTTGGSLSSSADRLERSAAAFQRDADTEREGRSFERDAQDLAAEARDFREVLSDRDADDGDVRDAFSDLSRSYHAARDEVERHGDKDSERNFAPVTEAYLDLERAMTANDDRRARYDRDD